MVDAHDGRLSLSAMAFWLSALAFLINPGLSSLGALGISVLALEHRRRVNAKYDARLEKTEDLLRRMNELEPKVREVLNERYVASNARR
jgi:hypothetical protein